MVSAYICTSMLHVLTFPQWTDATFSVGGAAYTHRLTPLPDLQQFGGQIFRQVMRAKDNIVGSCRDNTDKPKLLKHILNVKISLGS